MSALTIIDLEKTKELGTPSHGLYTYDFKSPTGLPVSYIKFTYNVDRLKGIVVKFHGSDEQYVAGDWKEGRPYASEVSLALDDVIVKCTASIGTEGAVRGFELQTRNGVVWNPGFITSEPAGFTDDSCRNRVLMGLFCKINKQFWLDSLGLWVNKR